MMRRALILALAGSASMPSAMPSAQAPAPTAPPAFEVASIKPSPSDDSGFRWGPQPGGWSMINSPVSTLIRAAYPAPLRELVNAPAWVMSERYDVTAKADGSPNREAMTLMLRSLLADRFKLSAHYETREAPVFALVVARADGRAGAGLRQSTVDCDALSEARRAGRQPDVAPLASGASPCTWSAQFSDAATVSFGGLPLSRLPEAIGEQDGRVVIDRTGLTGTYEFTLRYAPDQRTTSGELPSLFTALEEQLGLKLVPDRAPLQVLVIDHIERPTPD